LPINIVLRISIDSLSGQRLRLALAPGSCSFRARVRSRINTEFPRASGERICSAANFLTRHVFGDD
jgi:hypothetical protein